MREYLLTVVIPTRNRPESLLRLLENFRKQTLSPDSYEVVVVDDGSEPPLAVEGFSARLPFLLRVIRRTSDQGAHESRFAGLREAQGTRVLFLDDDLTLSPEVLAEHASVVGRLATGPIFYHPDASKTPYQRFQTRRYEQYARAVHDPNAVIAPGKLDICNSSGPRAVFLEAFEALGKAFVGTHMAGDGFDEELLDHQLRNHESTVMSLPKAMVFHIDNKSTADARKERLLHGILECRLLLQFPELKHEFASYEVLTGSNRSLRTWKAKMFWIAPGFFRVISDFFTFAADRGPSHLVPASLCRIPLSIAFWQGMQSVAPSFATLRSALLESSGTRH